MPLTYYRRHTSKCVQHRPRHERTYESDEHRRGFRNCDCPIQAEGTVRGKFDRKSTGQIDWMLARQQGQIWEINGWPGCDGPMHLRYTSDSAVPDRNAKGSVTLSHAVSEFLADMKARRLTESTARKYRTFTKQLLEYARGEGLLYVDDWNVEQATRFRGTWNDGIRSGAKKLERMKMFFQFAADRHWIAASPAKPLKPAPGASKPLHKNPFTDEEIERIYAACSLVKPCRWSNGYGTGVVTGEDMTTFIMLLLSTGLRISDAATFSADKLNGNDAFLFQHKTGNPVYAYIPDELVQRLKARPLVGGKYFFLGPTSDRKETAADLWRRKINEVFALAGKWENKPTPHRFRHTFVRICLQNGMRPAEVAELIGDTEAVVLKHYARWVPERQDRIRERQREMWESRQRRSKLTVNAGSKRPA